MKSFQLKKLKQALDRVLENKSPDPNTDPLFFPHLYQSKQDQELAAFLAAHFAFGNVRSIQNHLSKIHQYFGPSLSEGISQKLKTASRFPNFQYRWISAKDHRVLFKTLKLLIDEQCSIESIFMGGHQPDHMKASLGHFAMKMRALFAQQNQGVLSRGLKFFVSLPGNSSVSKRSNLFLRWVVRKQAPDLGIWNGLSEQELLVPIDTHLGRIARYVGLTQEAKVSWKMLEELSQNLHALDAKDPTKYDFALSHLGIDRSCRHAYLQEICERCPLVGLCHLAKDAKIKKMN